MWWAEGRKKIGVFGYMTDYLQPTQVKGGRLEGKGSRSEGFVCMARPKAHLGLSSTRWGG